MSKRELVQSLSGEYPVRLLCRVVSLAPSTYYYCGRERDDLSLLSLIEGVLLRFPTYGYRRVTAQLRREGEVVNHKRVLRVMRENDLIEGFRRRRTGTTSSKHGYKRYPNLLRGVIIDRPDQIWCADITYVQLQHHFVYLAVSNSRFGIACHPLASPRAQKTGLWIGVLASVLRNEASRFSRNGKQQ